MSLTEITQQDCRGKTVFFRLTASARKHHCDDETETKGRKERQYKDGRDPQRDKREEPKAHKSNLKCESYLKC